MDRILITHESDRKDEVELNLFRVIGFRHWAASYFGILKCLQRKFMAFKRILTI